MSLSLFDFKLKFLLSHAARRCGTVPAHIPIQAMNNNKASKIHSNNLPQPTIAVQNYRSSGGQLTDPDNVFRDPLFNSQAKVDMRKKAFMDKISLHSVFFNLANNNPEQFKRGLKLFIDITRRLSLTH